MVQSIWKTKEFREAKEKFIEEGKFGKKCEWCKSTEGLSPEHTFSYKAMLFQYNRQVAIEMMSKEREFTFTDSAINNRGGFSINKGKGYIKKPELQAYMRENETVIREKAKQLADERYFSFKDVITLCKRCHFAKGKGMFLCGYCKKNYYKPNYREQEISSCKNCIDKARKEEKEFEKDMEEHEKCADF